LKQLYAIVSSKKDTILSKEKTVKARKGGGGDVSVAVGG
jgi:hypothetical protein